MKQHLFPVSISLLIGIALGVSGMAALRQHSGGTSVSPEIPEKHQPETSDTYQYGGNDLVPLMVPAKYRDEIYKELPAVIQEIEENRATVGRKRKTEARARAEEEEKKRKAAETPVPDVVKEAGIYLLYQDGKKREWRTVFIHPVILRSGGVHNLSVEIEEIYTALTKHAILHAGIYRIPDKKSKPPYILYVVPKNKLSQAAITTLQEVLKKELLTERYALLFSDIHVVPSFASFPMYRNTEPVFIYD